MLEGELLVAQRDSFNVIISTRTTVEGSRSLASASKRVEEESEALRQRLAEAETGAEDDMHTFSAHQANMSLTSRAYADRRYGTKAALMAAHAKVADEEKKCDLLHERIAHIRPKTQEAKIAASKCDSELTTLKKKSDAVAKAVAVAKKKKVAAEKKLDIETEKLKLCKQKLGLDDKVETEDERETEKDKEGAEDLEGENEWNPPAAGSDEMEL
jgi:hypothetical protein